MTLLTGRAASVALTAGLTVCADAAALTLRPLEGNPPAVSALAAGADIEAFALAAASATAVVAVASTAGDGAVSALRYARGTEPPRTVPLSGKVVGLAMPSDGSACYAVVRVSTKKGAVRSMDLVRIDLRTARASPVVSLPQTAAGLAISGDDGMLLVAAKDEVRTFTIPAAASGRLYRVAGDNVGVSPVHGTSFAVVAQRSRVALVDLASPQGREGLDIKDEVPAPAPLHGLLASVGEGGPIAMAGSGPGWRVEIGDLPVPPVVTPPPPPPPADAEPEAAPADAAPPATAAVDAPPRTLPPPPPSPTPEPILEPMIAASPAEPGAVRGRVTGPAAKDVAAVIVLGPDNILREAARVAPDAQGRYETPPLAAGAYRIVASGKAGRVLICQPPFVSIRVGSSSAVEAPELSVLRAE